MNNEMRDHFNFNIILMVVCTVCIFIVIAGHDYKQSKAINRLETRIDSLLILQQEGNGMKDELKEIVGQIRCPNLDGENDCLLDSIALLGYAKVKLGLDWGTEYKILKQSFKRKNLNIYTIWAYFEFLYAAGKDDIHYLMNLIGSR